MLDWRRFALQFGEHRGCQFGGKGPHPGIPDWKDFEIFASEFSHADSSIKVIWTSLSKGAIFLDVSAEISGGLIHYEVYSKPGNAYAAYHSRRGPRARPWRRDRHHRLSGPRRPSQRRGPFPPALPRASVGPSRKPPCGPRRIAIALPWGSAVRTAGAMTGAGRTRRRRGPRRMRAARLSPRARRRRRPRRKASSELIQMKPCPRLRPPPPMPPEAGELEEHDDRGKFLQD